MTQWKPPLRFARAKAPTDPDEGPFTGPEIKFTGANYRERRKQHRDFITLRRRRTRKQYTKSPPASYR